MAKYTLYSYDTQLGAGGLSLPVGEVVQISELSIVRGSEIDAHIQECDEITYAISGKALFTSGSSTAEVCKGQLHYIKKGMYHKITAREDEDFRYICIGIRPNPEYEAISAFTKLDMGGFFVANDNGIIRTFSQMLVNEFFWEDENSPIMANAYITQLLVSIARIFDTKKKDEEPKKSFANTASDQTFYKLLRHIDKEYINITTVKQLASEFSYSEYYISHIFKLKLGTSIKKYITGKKIAHSCEMLRTTNISIEQISDYLNFATPHTFRQAFKRITGTSPYEYRKKFENKK